MMPCSSAGAGGAGGAGDGGGDNDDDDDDDEFSFCENPPRLPSWPSAFMAFWLAAAVKGRRRPIHCTGAFPRWPSAQSWGH